jgi:hypothetical protein
MLTSEHVYTHTGLMRPVFLCGEGPHAFAVELQPGDEARVQLTYDPTDNVRKGKAEWLPFEGGLGGVVHGATALRLHVGKLGGWVSLKIAEQESL